MPLDSGPSHPNEDKDPDVEGVAPRGSSRPGAHQQSPQNDGGSFIIAVIGGIPIRIHITFLLLLAWIGFAGAESGKGKTGSGLVFILMLFGCVLLHELSHAMVAKRYGVRTLSITLYPIGGVALLEQSPRPRQEFWIALAGPLMNFLLAGITALALLIGHSRIGAFQLGQSRSGLLSDLLWANLILGGFNMIPAFPMDGGRVLRSLIAQFTDEVRATEIAATIGQLLAMAIGVFALVQGQFLLVLVALFVYFGAGQEAGAFRTRALMLGHKVREAMMTEVRTLPVGITLKEAAQTLLSGSQHDFPVMNGDEVVGLLAREDLMRGMASQDDNTYIAGIMNREYPRTTSDADLDAVLTGFGRAGTVLVVDTASSGHEVLVGMLTQENSIEFLMLAQLASRRAARSR